MTDRSKLRQSIRNFKRLLALEPGHLGHLERLARLSAELNKPKEAAKYLLDRAQALADQSAWSAALSDAQAALAFDGRSRRARKLVARLEHAAQPRPASGVSAGPTSRSSSSLTPRPSSPPRRVHAPVEAPPVRPARESIAPSVSLAELEEQISIFDIGAPVEESEPVYDASALLAVHEVDELELVEEEADAPVFSFASIEGQLTPHEVLGDSMPSFDLEPLELSDVIPTMEPDAVLPEEDDPYDKLQAEIDYGSLPTMDEHPDEFEADPDPAFEFDLVAAEVEDRPTVPFSAIQHSRGQLDRGTIDLDDDDDQDVSEVEMVSAAPAAIPASGLIGPPVSAPPRPIQDTETIADRTPKHGLPHIPLLDGIPADRLAHLEQICRTEKLPGGTVIAAAGERYSGALIVVSGAIVVERGDDKISELYRAGPGDFVGLVEGFRGGAWRHEVVAAESSEVLHVTANQLSDLRRRFPRIERVLSEEVERREGLYLVASCRLFRSLSPDAQSMVASHLEARHLIAGEVLHQAGAPTGGLHLVASGTLVVTHWGQPRGELGVGDCVGVLAALGAGASHATVRAKVPTDVFRLDRSLLPTLLGDPEIHGAFMRASEVRRMALDT